MKFHLVHSTLGKNPIPVEIDTVALKKHLKELKGELAGKTLTVARVVEIFKEVINDYKSFMKTLNKNKMLEVKAPVSNPIQVSNRDESGHIMLASMKAYAGDDFVMKMLECVLDIMARREKRESGN